METLKKFIKEEDGMGTVEIVMLIAALMCVALMFRSTITKYAENIMKTVFKVDVEEPTGKDVMDGN